ncbi:MAG: carbon-nitrogen hydrolase family protein [bacterium]
MATSRFPAACIQMRVVADKARNLELAEKLIEEAAGGGARLVALPEMFFWRGRLADHRAAAERIDGPTIERLGRLSARLGITLVVGSILEDPGDPDALPFNTMVVLGPAGECLGVYRKIHLFDIEIPGKVRERESERMQPGSTPVCIDTPAGRLGLSVCYDLRFPELYRALVRAGAEILLVPAAFTATTGAAHWEVLLRARAIENQCWLMAPAQIGPVDSGPPVWGHSCIIDPWGEVAAMRAEGEGIVPAEIDLEELARVRRDFPCLEHARVPA